MHFSLWSGWFSWTVFQYFLLFLFQYRSLAMEWVDSVSFSKFYRTEKRIIFRWHTIKFLHPHNIYVFFLLAALQSLQWGSVFFVCRMRRKRNCTANLGYLLMYNQCSQHTNFSLFFSFRFFSSSSSHNFSFVNLTVRAPFQTWHILFFCVSLAVVCSTCPTTDTT